MKLKTSLPDRRDGAPRKLQIPCARDKINRDGFQTFLPDAAGEYDVPDTAVVQLLATGNFYLADGSESKPVVEPTAEPVAETPATGNVIVCEDGAKKDLDAMTRAELEAFAADSFDLKFKQTDNKPAIVAAIMAEVTAE